MRNATTSIEDFLNATAARQPTPGGGAVSALAGALAAAIGEMAVNYSIGRKDLAEARPALEEALRVLSNARKALLELMVEDQLAYEAVAAARALAKTEVSRPEQQARALQISIQTPQVIGSVAMAILELCDGVVGIVNPYLLSDLAVCGELAMATVRCAGYNVRINLKEIADAGERAALEGSLEAVHGRAVALIQRIIDGIWNRVSRADGSGG